jgi:hypothetical protein
MVPKDIGGHPPIFGVTRAWPWIRAKAKRRRSSAALPATSPGRAELLLRPFPLTRNRLDEDGLLPARLPTNRYR